MNAHNNYNFPKVLYISITVRQNSIISKFYCHLNAMNPRSVRLGKFSAYPIERIGDNSPLQVEEAKHGGKIVLPASVLQTIAHRGPNQNRIMIFKLINDNLKKHVFCGVFTFDGEAEKVSVPVWMLHQLQIEPGEKVSIEYLTAPIQTGQFAKFEPLSKSFLSVSDPKAMLEYCMKMYICISCDDVISVYYEHQIYEFRICETQPANTVVITDTDLEVDFAEMKAEEPKVQELPKECDLDELQAQTSDSFKPFSGSGQSTGGKKSDSDVKNESSNQMKPKIKRGIPDFDWKMGTLLFKRYKKDIIQSQASNESRKSENQSNDSKDSSEEKNKGIVKRQLKRRGGPITRSQAKGMRNKVNDKKPETTNSRETQTLNEKSNKKKSNKKKKEKQNEKNNENSSE